MPERVTRLEMIGGIRGRGLMFFAPCVSSQIFLLPHAVSVTVCLKCTALAFLMVASSKLSASRYVLRAPALGYLLCSLLALLTTSTSLVSSLDHRKTEKGAG